MDTNVTASKAKGMNQVTVAIIDDNRLVRQALTAMLIRLTDMRVLSSAVADAAFLADAKPDVLLLDAGLHDQDSLHLAARLTREAPRIKLIVMDMMPMHEEIIEFVSAGVAGFLVKDATVNDLVATIRSVVAGERVLPPDVTETVFAQMAREASAESPAPPVDDVRITKREREVIDLIAEGLSNREIAERMSIASHTVKSHVRNVMEKLALHTRLQIAAYTRRDGMA